jgi:hypothetical protein
MDLVSVFYMADTQFSQQHSLKRLFFSPSFVLGAFVKNQVGVAAWISVFL